MEKRNFRIKIPKNMNKEELATILNKHDIALIENKLSQPRLKRLNSVLEWLDENPKEVLSTSQYCFKFKVNNQTAWNDMKLLHKEKKAHAKVYLCKDNKTRYYLGKNKEMVELIVKLQD